MEPDDKWTRPNIEEYYTPEKVEELVKELADKIEHNYDYNFNEYVTQSVMDGDTGLEIKIYSIVFKCKDCGLQSSLTTQFPFTKEYFILNRYLEKDTDCKTRIMKRALE